MSGISGSDDCSNASLVILWVQITFEGYTQGRRRDGIRDRGDAVCLLNQLVIDGELDEVYRIPYAKLAHNVLAMYADCLIADV